MELDFTKLMIEAGALGLAAFVVKMLNQVWADRVAATERHAAALQVNQEAMTAALVDVTRALTRLETKIGVSDGE